MKKKKLINWLCLSGLVSIVFYLLHDVVGAMKYPGYNWLSQAVSDLTATDSKSYVITSGFICIYRIFNFLCCALLCMLVSDEDKKFKIGVYLFSIMNFISAIGYSLFPLSSSGYDGSTISFIHVYVLTALVVVLSIVSLILIAIGSLKENKKVLGILAIISLVLMFVGSMGTGNAPKAYFGLFERFSTYSAVIYTGILGLYGFKKQIK